MNAARKWMSGHLSSALFSVSDWLYTLACRLEVETEIYAPVPQGAIEPAVVQYRKEFEAAFEKKPNLLRETESLNAATSNGNQATFLDGPKH